MMRYGRPVSSWTDEQDVCEKNEKRQNIYPEKYTPVIPACSSQVNG